MIAKRREKTARQKVEEAIERQGLSIAEIERLAHMPEGSLGQMLKGKRAISEIQVENLERVIEEGIDRRELTPASYYI